MGQYYIPYVRKGDKEKTFSNKVDGDYNGYKLMEHSYWHNEYVGQVINEIFYNKSHVCWVGDYFEEDDYSQVNCDKEEVKRIGELTWRTKDAYEVKSTRRHVRFLDGCFLVNHTKQEYIDCDAYFEKNKIEEEWNGKIYHYAVNPLPLLTCSASHSGGCYRGINYDQCGIWFNDELEVILYGDLKKLIDQGYMEREFEFREE